MLGGYSQGGAMALAALLDPTLAARPGGVAALAAYLPHRDVDQDPALAAGPPVLLAHGADDDVVDAAPRAERGQGPRTGSGATVTWAEVDGDHRLGPPLLDGSRWLDAWPTATRPRSARLTGQLTQRPQRRRARNATAAGGPRPPVPHRGDAVRFTTAHTVTHSS